MITTRRQILDFIRKHQTVTASELGRGRHMTVENARHHLRILEHQGLVVVVGERRAEGRGRPAKVFGLSDQVIGDNLGNLVSAVLAEFFQMETVSIRSERFQALVSRMIDRSSQGIGISDGKKMGSLPQRLYAAITILNEMNYQARWEAHADSPRVILGHCPYSEIITDHPELCTMDAKMLETLLHEPVIQLEKLETDVRGVRYCLFSVVGFKQVIDRIAEPPHNK